MRKPDFCKCENKDADNREADQRLRFRYTDSTMLLVIFCGCTARFVSDLSETPKPVFSQRGSFDELLTYFHDTVIIVKPSWSSQQS